MGNAKAGGWRYSARYRWNWRSVRAIGRGLSSLALPMPPWFRVIVARCLVTRTALHADAQGIWGSAGPLPAGPAGPCPCPWTDVTDVVVWQYDRLKIIGLARRGDTAGGGPAARTPASRTSQPRPVRHRAFVRHPSVPAFIAPDGSPYGAANVVTANGWCVDIARLQATVRHFAPKARFLDLSGVSVAPESGAPFPVEALAGLIELIGWRRLGWLLGIAAAAAVLAVSAAGLVSGAYAVAGVAAGALAVALFTWRAVAVRHRRRRIERPEAWLESGREDAESSPLARLRRGRLAVWTLRVSPPAVRRRRRGGRGRAYRR